MKRLIPVLLLTLALAGCRTESGASPEAQTAGASGENGASVDTTEAASAFQITPPERVDGVAETTREVKLVGQNDDGTACYLMVENGEQMELLLAEKELCGITYEFEGERVVITQADATVAALTCEGDPDCPEPETIQMVVDVKRP